MVAEFINVGRIHVALYKFKPRLMNSILFLLIAIINLQETGVNCEDISAQARVPPIYSNNEHPVLHVHTQKAELT